MDARAQRKNVYETIAMNIGNLANTLYIVDMRGDGLVFVGLFP